MVDNDGALNNFGGTPGSTLPMLASEYSTTIVNAHQLQLMAMALGANYRLGANVDASVTATAQAAANGADVWSNTGFAPIGGNFAANFTGTLNGQNRIIRNLTIDARFDGVLNDGLFGSIGVSGSVSNVGLVGGAVYGNGDGTAGAIAGFNNGTVTNVQSSVTVTGPTAGGLIGSDNGTVSNSSASGSVTAYLQAGTIGGLVGNEAGTISNSFATGAVSDGGNAGSTLGGLVGSLSGTITTAYAAGSVTGGDNSWAGGLVGENRGAISVAYATGTVVVGTGRPGTVGGRVNNAGGLVGGNDNGASILNAYATGSVTAGASTNAGGLIGNSSVGSTATNAYALGAVTGGGTGTTGAMVGNDDGTGTFTALYWDKTTTGSSTPIGTGSSTGMTGLTTLQWLTQGPVATSTFDTTAIWVAGYPYPVLQALPYVLVGGAGTVTYGTATPAITIGTVKDQNGNNAAGLIGTGGLSWISTALSTSTVGSGSFVAGGIGGTVSAGYQLTYNATATIAAAALTVTANNRVKTYGQTATLGTTAFTTSGLVNGDSVTGATLTSAGSIATATVAGGPYAIVASAATGSGLANYTITYNNGSLTVNTAPLTIAAVNQSKTAGQSLTLGTTAFTATGLFNGDTVTGVTLTSLGAPASAGIGGSPYAIVVANAIGIGLANYAIGYVNGSLTVTTTPVPQPVFTLASLPQPVPSDGAQALILVPGALYGPQPAIMADDGIPLGDDELDLSGGLQRSFSREQAQNGANGSRRLIVRLPSTPPVLGGMF